MKIPDFKEQKFSDLIPTKSIVNKEMQTGKFTNNTSQRGEKSINYIKIYVYEYCYL